MPVFETRQLIVYIIYIPVNIRDEDPVLAKKPDPELCTSNERKFLTVISAKGLDNFKTHFLFPCFRCQTNHRDVRFRKPARIR